VSPDVLFALATASVVPGWLLLAIYPASAFTRRYTTVAAPVLLGLLYLYLMVTNLGGTEGGFGSLTDVELLFGNRQLLLAGWVHFLAFHLFVGAWEVRDARRLGLRHGLVIPCLALTFVLGPIGLLAYLGLRVAMRGTSIAWKERSRGKR